MTPEVHTLDPAGAHPLYLRWMSWRSEGLKIAAELANAGEVITARKLRDAVDSATVAVGDAIPRTR